MRNRTDNNQEAIFGELERAGVLVFRTPRQGGGFPDGGGYCVGTGIFRLLEVKSQYGKLTPAQDAWRLKNPRLAAFTVTVRSAGEALRAFRILP